MLVRATGNIYSYGRSPAYRRIASFATRSIHPASFNILSKQFSAQRQTVLQSTVFPNTLVVRPLSPFSTRPLHTTARLLQEQSEKLQSESEKKSASGETNNTKEGNENQEKHTSQNEQKKDEEGKQEGKEEGEEEKSKEKKDDLPPPPPHGDKTPWQVFMDTMQSELKASKEWNEGTKAIADSANRFAESDQVRKTREAYEKTSGAVSQTASRVVKSTATAVGKGAAWTWDTPVMKGVRKGANVTGEALDKATKPIRDTEAYKSVKETLDDGSSSRYGGWQEKEERRKWREIRDKKMGVKPPETIQEDPNAGTNITLHKDAAWKEAWRDFRDNNKMVQHLFGLKSVYQESENPLISTARGITDSIAGFFSENETAEVIKKFRVMDPAFRLEPFLEELREYILPEVLDAYVKGDTEVLKLWLSAAQYSVYEALTKQYLQMGMKSDGKILDIRHVDILRARMLEPGEVPVFIVTCRTQEVHVYRHAKSGELAAGMEDKVQLVTYAIGITRTPEDVSNPETRGWRLIEMQKSARDYY